MAFWHELDNDVERNKGCLRSWFNVNESDATEYARFVALLSDKARFMRALERLSADVWYRYLEVSARRGSNRLSTAIKYIGEGLGFHSFLDDNLASSHVVYIGQLSQNAFLSNLERKVLFKDSFGLGHGEFSHSYQWLAGGMALGWLDKTAELYSGSRIISNEPLWHLSKGKLIQEHVALWEWLVDSVNCRDTRPDDFSQNHIDYNGHCLTEGSFRFANNVQSLLTENQGWFLGYYANHRTDRLKDIENKTFTEARSKVETDGAAKRMLAPDGRTKSYKPLHAQQRGLKDHYEKLSVQKHGVLADGIYSGKPEVEHSIPHGKATVKEVEFHGMKGVIRTR